MLIDRILVHIQLSQVKRSFFLCNNNSVMYLYWFPKETKYKKRVLFWICVFVSCFNLSKFLAEHFLFNYLFVYSVVWILKWCVPANQASFLFIYFCSSFLFKFGIAFAPFSLDRYTFSFWNNRTVYLILHCFSLPR